MNESGNRRSEFTYNGLSQRVKIVEKTNGSVTSTKNLVWVGSGICEQRDASNNVTKRYYPKGMRIGSTNYYYTRDHLGSVRELTNGSAAVQTRYDYDPYGRRTRLTGTIDADFGFTGHYYHQPSGLHLALYRAYNADLGRWISRDPVGELGGINVYGYVLNNPIKLFDPFGLDALVFDGTVISYLNSNGDVVMTLPGISGPYNNGALPNGLYAADNYRDRGPGAGDDYNPKMTIDDFGFSYDLTPAFPTDRTLLRIHPDGGKPGTEGCIGLRARRKQLQDFVNRVNAYVRAYGMIPVLVNQ